MFFYVRDKQPNTKTESKLLLSSSSRSAFLGELQKKILCNFLFNWNFDEDSPDTAKENFLGVNFSQSRGKFRFVGKFGNNQHWWCLTIQPAIVRPIYAERGTISKSWQGHNKAQGNIHSQMERQEFIKEKNVFFFEANLLYFEPGITFRLCLLIKKWLQVDIIDF